MTSKFIVDIWDMGANRGRGTLKACIQDAKDIGVSSYANEAGEAFFTLPWDHPAASQIKPWERHFEVLRYSGSSYATMGVGVLNDLTADRNEVIAYGLDYLGLMGRTISASQTSYTSQFIGTILSTEIGLLKTGLSVPPLAFTTTGTIDTTSKTTTVLTSYEPRLNFFQSLLQILMEGGTTRPILSVTRTSPFTISFNQNGGSDRADKRLVFGHNVNDFDYKPGYDQLVTEVFAIGQRREGATVLFSHQSYAAAATYGTLQTGRVFVDVVNQTANDNKTLTEARRLARIPKALALRLRQQALVPWDGFDLADSFPVYISRGAAAVNTSMTLWGLEWVGKKDGSEDLFLDLQPKET